MAAGDKISTHDSKMWQIAASGVLTDLLSKMNGMPDSYQNTQNQSEFVSYLRIVTAQPGSLKTVFFQQVYADLLARIVDYNYSNARIEDVYLAPASPAVSGNTVTCLKDTTDAARRARLYLWNYADFVESAVTATLSGGIWTFADVPAGVYVIAFEQESLPTGYLTVS